MKATFLRLILPVLLFACFTSCDDEPEDGAVPLKWEDSADIQLGVWDAKVDVPAEGASYSLVCINARETGIGLSEVRVDEQLVDIVDYTLAEGEWGKIVCEGKNVTVTIAPNTTDKERVISAIPSQVGYFYYLIFTQQPAAK